MGASGGLSTGLTGLALFLELTSSLIGFPDFTGSGSCTVRTGGAGPFTCSPEPLDAPGDFGVAAAF